MCDYKNYANDRNGSGAVLPLDSKINILNGEKLPRADIVPGHVNDREVGSSRPLLDVSSVFIP